MREIDIIKEDIRCCDDFDVYPNDSINITYELWFDVDKYFGTHTHETSSWINFYTFFHKDGTAPGHGQDNRPCGADSGAR